MERDRLHGGVGKQLGRSCSSSCASMACGQLDILRSFVLVHELVQACGIGVAVIDLHTGGAVAGDGERFGRHQAGKQLRRLANALIVVYQHVGERMGGNRAGVAAQVIHRQIARFGLDDAAREGQVVLQQRVHVGLLTGQKPVRIVIGKLGPAAVEELQHLAQALGAQAAHLHIFEQEQLLVGGEQTRLAA